MILTKFAIRDRMKEGKIKINPFDDKMLNPNSINLKLGHKLLTYRDATLDPKKENPVDEHFIMKQAGFKLMPGQLYLGHTYEYTETHDLVPMIEGRSSWGRLGLFVHVTAGFGDTGFCGFWTLELMVIKPLIIYPEVPICQIFYHTVEGVTMPYLSDKYQNNSGVQPSMLWRELK